MTQQDTQHTPGDPQETVSANLPDVFPKMTLGRFLVALFAYPRLAILNARSNKTWGQCILIIFVMSVLTAVVKSYLLLPELKQQSNTAVELCIDTLGGLIHNVKDNSFDWLNKDIETPHTARSGNWRIDVLQARDEFNQADTKLQNETWGIIVARDKISFWTRNVMDASALLFVDNIPQQTISDFFRQLGTPGEDSFTLSPEELRTIGAHLPLVLSFILVLYYAVSFIELIFTCIVIFVLMSMMFRRSDKAPFGAVLASSLACTLPPFILALGFSLIPAIPVPVNTLFTIFFVIYLVVLFLDRSVVIKVRER